jgi:hypothetical protein
MICDSAVERCIDQECADNDGCAKGLCVSVDDGADFHGRCDSECTADTDCEATQVCDTDVERCIEQLCADTAECEMGVCTTPHGRCEAECAEDGDCADGICDAAVARCIDAECTTTDDCEMGACMGGRCADECTLDKPCLDEMLACDTSVNRCVDKNILYPPVELGWKTFIVKDEAGNVLVDVSDKGQGNIDVMSDIVKNGGVVHIEGEVKAENADIKKAWLKVQYGKSDCMSEDGLPPKTDVIELSIKDGKIVSDKGDFHVWYLSGGYEQLQLVAAESDDMSGELYESGIVTVDGECNPAHDLTIYFSWNTDRVDMDLHVWNAEGERTFYASKFEGKYKRSSYGMIDVDDRNGFGPEVFTLNRGQEGKFKLRAHFFSGRQTAEFNPTEVTVRAVWRDAKGEWHDTTTTISVGWRKWGEIGVIDVGARPASE